jgi:hypothetical protein
MRVVPLLIRINILQPYVTALVLCDKPLQEFPEAIGVLLKSPTPPPTKARSLQRRKTLRRMLDGGTMLLGINADLSTRTPGVGLQWS